jgi:hypothetical protein
MKIIYNAIIPCRSFIAINFFGVIFVRNERKDTFAKDASNINHEMIHTAQMKELFYIGFYLLYFFFLCINIFSKSAYMAVKFEKEAYANENNSDYLKYRKHFSWIKY